MVEPFSLNFRVFTVKLVSIRKFRNFTVFSILQNTPEGMSDSSFHLAKFSPLKTPDIGKYRKTRDDDYVSSSSIASSVTNDIIRLSQDVTKKLKSDKKSSVSDSSPEKGSRGNIFLTQVP